MTKKIEDKFHEEMLKKYEDLDQQNADREGEVLARWGEAKSEIEALRTEMEVNYDNADIEAYKKNEEKLKELNIYTDMLYKQINNRKIESVLSVEEADEDVARIKEHFTMLNDKYKAEIIQITDRLAELYRIFEEEHTKDTELLSAVNVTLRRNNKVNLSYDETYIYLYLYSLSRRLQRDTQGVISTDGVNPWTTESPKNSNYIFELGY